VKRPPGASPKAPPGFTVEDYATGLEAPRLLRVAPNGDVFVAESRAGRVRVLRGGRAELFADGLRYPFGIAFYPQGEPQFVYIAETGAVKRFPYRSGDSKARGAAETVVPDLPVGGHSTRDLVFAPDGSRMFVSVGSRSNVQQYGDDETRRADILEYTPDGRDGRIFASGIRNAVGLAIQPATGALWASVNERDGLGDDLPPDYITRVRDGGFYGWPWFYIGDHPDPRHRGARAELKHHVIVPDVLIQPHSASMQLSFYDGPQFPAEYRGDAFAAQHGSWNRSKLVGYKVIRVRLQDGVPTGEYQDFLTGFVVADGKAWGRPVGVAVAADGALLVSDDASGTIFRIAYGSPPTPGSPAAPAAPGGAATGSGGSGLSR
jgi:glucose/arabinose dehydrogenase